MFKAVIFDFDGTLVDSEWAYALTDTKLIKALGGKPTDIEHLDFMGHGVKTNISKIRKALGITDRSVEELIQLNDDIYMDIAKEEVEVFPTMFKLLKELHKKNIPMAVATGSSESVIGTIASTTGIDHYIETLYSSESCQTNKPDPDKYLLAAEKLGVKPEDCLVLEDSQTGVSSAYRAGMNVIWLDNVGNKNRTLQKQIYKYYPNGHTDLDYREILELFN